jgi:hypothetical protein
VTKRTKVRISTKEAKRKRKTQLTRCRKKQGVEDAAPATPRPPAASRPNHKFLPCRSTCRPVQAPTS